MACYSPIQAYLTSGGSVVFSELRRHDIVRSMQLACGQCVGCRLKRSREWATRCMHEASLHEHNCFLTLTYKDAGFSLRYKDFQDFMKRLRKRTGKPVRFFMCGEYGELFSRPHFHACLFGYSFLDRVYHMVTGSGARIYRSDELENLWTHGFASIGELTFDSAAYVARYCMKKLGGPIPGSVFDVESGEVFERCPEFVHMSLRPGIGSGWFDKYMRDIYPKGLVVINGMEVSPPKYYDRKLAKMDDSVWADLAMRREQFAHAHFEDNSDERLRAKETVQRAALNLLKRGLV